MDDIARQHYQDNAKMSDNITRHKSQRWVSASKANYDGADWDAYSSNSEDEGLTNNIPQLPQVYIPESNNIAKSSSPDPSIGTCLRSDSLNTSVRSGNKSVNDDLDSLMHQISQEMTAKDEDVNNTSDPEDEDDAELKVSKTGYFAAYVNDEDTDDRESVKSDIESAKLAESATEINKTDNAKAESVSEVESVAESVKRAKVEVEPVQIVNVGEESFKGDDSEAESVKRADVEVEPFKIVSAEEEPLKGDDTEVELFKNAASEVETSQISVELQDEMIDPTTEIPSRIQGDVAISDDKGSKDAVDEDNWSKSDSHPESIGSQDKEEMPPSSINSLPSESQLSIQHSKEGDSNDSDSLLNGYGSEPSLMKDNASPVKLRKTSKTDLSYHDGYSSESSGEEKERAISEVSLGQYVVHSAESFKFRNPVRNSVLDSSDDDIDYTDEDGDLEVTKSGYFAAMVDEDKEIDDSDRHTLNNNDTDGLTADSDVNSITESVTKRLSQSSITQSDVPDQNSENDVGGYSDSSEDEEDGPQKLAFSTRESINLGKWKPDTDAFRSGFVTETIDINNPPEGYTVNEDGEIVEVNKNTTSNIQRNSSVASDGESQFNAFPHDVASDDDDLKTIADTKTIYDNQTIYNVPALIANNASAPALPTNIQITNESTDYVSSNDTIFKHVNGEAPKGESKLKEAFSSEGDEIPSVVHQSTVPNLDLVKLLSSNELHSQKLKKLNNYKEQLKEYDSGLQSWIQYALKSSTTSDKDFIFKDYKVNKHVQDAYAQADILSKKNSVANTVNQNVTHLKKKMFSSSMREKSKGLFSSIGKKL